MNSIYLLTSLGSFLMLFLVWSLIKFGADEDDDSDPLRHFTFNKLLVSLIVGFIPLLNEVVVICCSILLLSGICVMVFTIVKKLLNTFFEEKLGGKWKNFSLYNSIFDPFKRK